MRRILISAVLMGFIFFQKSYSLKFVAYGDSRSNAGTHQGIVNKFCEENPELVIHSGDLWDGYASSTWVGHIQGNSVSKSLHDANKFLVAKGNHESSSEVYGISPTIVRDNSTSYAYREGNCFFVCMGESPSGSSWLETQLQSTESQTADWRFIYAHKPIYSTGDHGASGNSSFEALCDQYKVTMFFAGHDHIYERTHLIYDRQTASEDVEINISETPGTFYVVTGGGGAPLYSTGSGWWVNINERTYHYCVIDASSDRLTYAAKDENGNILDAVTLIKDTGPYATLSIPNGGEKWEQKGTYTITWSDNIDENVQIELYKGGILNSTIAGSTESDGEYEWEIPADQETGDDYKIKVSSVNSDTVFGESSANFSIEAEFILTIPYVQNFDNLDTGTVLPEKWEQLSTEDFDWIVWTGPTPSKTGSSPDITGPDGDHTSGNGNYIYMEASDPNNPGKKADFVSPKFDISFTNNMALTFWCHMFSSQNEMGDLYLDIEVDGKWQDSIVHLTGDNGDAWFEVTQDLSSYKGDRMRLRFSGITGQSWASDICIDDLKVEGATAISLNNKMSSSPVSLKVFGNRICYNIPDNHRIKNKRVTIKLFDVKGKLIRTLVDGMSSPGTHFADPNPITSGKPLSAGLYLCRLEIQNFKTTITVLIKK